MLQNSPLNLRNDVNKWRWYLQTLLTLAARKDEDNKEFSGCKERTEDKVIAKESDGQSHGICRALGGPY